MSVPAINIKTYLLFGRQSYSEPLHYIDEFEIEPPGDIRTTVFSNIEKANWLELIVFPAKAAIQVIPRDVEP